MSGRTHTTRFRIRKAAVAEARRHVEALLVEWRLGHLVEPATLVTSELATNVVLHAQGIADYFELTVRRRDGVLILEVADSCTWEMPELRKPEPEDIGGRGLLLVDAFAERWGVRPRAGAGKTVWAHLAVRGGAGDEA
ncbi:ATP-binding protein [Streptomyces daliensis]|uniref:ATP-binding protein n=1 Tax=Streptomyces daliensis TaxID=299421 RepID=A0A8T4INC8_9ACTN|nr:ATP-binding protein [Streptomyces daliensis]